MRESPNHVKKIFTILFLIVSTALVAAAPPAPSLDTVQIPAGAQTAETILHVSAIGRYSVITKSGLGARIELVDRMAGTIGAAGKAGGVDAESGRIDSFLEPGEYKVRISKSSTDVVGLQARSFVTTNAGSDEFDVPELADGQGSIATLGDFELRSWWIRIDESNPILRLEMQGRCLTDAVLWKDGVLETGARPITQVMEREKGKPLTSLEFNARLEPGAYLLVCSGGPGKQWANEAADEPFSLKRGAGYLGEQGIMSVTFDGRGTESFLVSGGTDLVQMEARNNKIYRIAVARDTPGASRYAEGFQGQITEKSTSFRASVNGMGGTRQWVTVQGPAGETIELRWLSQVSEGSSEGFSSWNLSELGTRNVLATALSALEGKESIDMTGFALNISGSEQTPTLEPTNLQTMSIDPSHPIHRRVNALSSLSFLLQVSSAGYYAVSEKDTKTADARFLFQLLDDKALHGEGSPIEIRNNGRARLQAKLYIVVIVPLKAGVLDFAIFPTTIVGGGNASALFNSQPPSPANGLFWPGIPALSSSAGATLLILSSREGIQQGVSLRELPLDLSEPVCVRVDAGGSLQLPFQNKAEAVITSTNPGFSTATAQVDGTAWKVGRIISPGDHTLSISNTGKDAAWHVIAATPPVRPSTQKPRKAELSRLYPSFTQGVPVYRDFNRGESAGFLLSVTEPASYRVTTSGRLAMAVSIRTMLRPGLFSASQNTDGRNAAVSAYLRPGTYLVQATAQGASKGRAGLLLERLKVVGAGTLADGVVLRSTVPSGALLKADVKIDSEADFNLECLGLGHAFAYRFEDSDGWPIGDPIRSGTLTARLTPGLYHYVSAADPVSTRRLLSLSLIPVQSAGADTEKAKLVAMALNTSYKKLWMEAEGRPEDVFTLSCPAEIQGSLSLSDGMLYTVLDSKGSILYRGPGGQPQRMVLPGGSYQIKVISAAEDNLKPYVITFSTQDLFEGQAQSLAALPGSIPVSAGKAGSFEIWSYGANEVDAVLLDDSSNVGFRGQPISDDWNFRIVTDLKPGRYSLLLTSPEHVQTEPPAPQDVDGGGDEGYSEDEGYGGEEGYSEDQSYGGDQGYSGDEGYDEGDGYSGDSGDTLDQQQVQEQQPARTGSITAALVVRMVARPIITLPAIKGNLDTAVNLSGEVASVSFTPMTTGVSRFSTDSDRPLSVSVSKDGRILSAGTCPLFLPLNQGSSYDVRFWSSTAGARRVVLHAGPERSAETSLSGGEMLLDVKESALRISNPSGISFYSVSPAGASLLYASSPDLPFAPLTDAAVNTVSGAGWVMKPDGSPVGSLGVTPMTLADGAVRSFMIGGTSQVFSVQVPVKSAALVRTDNAGSLLGISASPAASFRGDAFDWQGSASDPLSSVVGMRDGAFMGKIWDAGHAGSAPENRRSVAADFYPVTSETALPKAGRIDFVVPTGSAVALTVSGTSRSVRISLERGMTAFCWNGKPVGTVDAARDDATGTVDISSGSIVIVNASSRSGLCAVTVGADPARLPLTDGDGYESVLSADRDLAFTVSSDRKSRIFVWGSREAPRFSSEDDGSVSTGEPMDTTMGIVYSLPAGRGVLEAAGAKGAFKAWIAKPETMRAAFAARDAGARSSSLPPEGAALTGGPQAWSFSVDRDSIASLTTYADGVTALSDGMGTLLGVSAGMGGRTLLLSLTKGSYTAFTRPFKGETQNGVLRMTALQAVTLDKEGEGDPQLLGPGDIKLFRFEVKAQGKTGAGIKVGRDGPKAVLFDARFIPLGSGVIFVRSLDPGSYYLLVESGGDTQTFTPVLFGLSGSRTQTPDDVVRSFSEE
jgi:hypothetical protein